MPRNESEAVPVGNDAVPQQEKIGSGQPMLAEVYRMVKELFDKSDWRFEKPTEELRSLDQRLTSLEQDARQLRLAMEADGPADTKTRERTEGAATAVQAMYEDSFSANQVDPDPKSTSTSFDVKGEPPALPCRMAFWSRTALRRPSHVSHSWRCSQQSPVVYFPRAKPLQQRRSPSTIQLFGSA